MECFIVVPNENGVGAAVARNAAIWSNKRLSDVWCGKEPGTYCSRAGSYAAAGTERWGAAKPSVLARSFCPIERCRCGTSWANAATVEIELEVVEESGGGGGAAAAGDDDDSGRMGLADTCPVLADAVIAPATPSGEGPPATPAREAAKAKARA